MNYHIERGGSETAYWQLYRQLRQDILEGVYPLGTKLPSKRRLAAELELSVITVEHALSLLVDEGYAQPRERSGLYVSFGGGAPRPRAGLDEMRLSTDVPKDFPFSMLSRIMRRVLTDYGERILMRSPNAGCAELRETLADYLLRSRGLHVQPQQIVVGSGAEYLYGLVVQLLGRERLYAHEEPCYDKIRRVYAAFGAQTVGLPMGDDGIARAALDACAAQVLHVTPYHSYPSGVSASAARRHEYARWARRRDAVIVEDDYDSELTVPSRQVETVFSLSPERVIYLNTFSKTMAPGMRMGYLVLPEPWLARYEEALGFYSCSVPVYEQLVLSEFIRSGELERTINRRRRGRA